MLELLSNVSIKVNEKIYLKNPESSELGIKIIAGSIDLIFDLGFESFTFRKLAKEIHSTEATVYRYFESKHKLLLYLISWYWGWLEYKMVFALANIASPKERLDIAIRILTEQIEEDHYFSHINEVKLNQIVISESAKGYLIKGVDKENKDGLFLEYKQLVSRVSDIILEIDPAYRYPHMLVSTVVEGAHIQRYFAAHLPRLTDTIEGEDSTIEFYRELVFRAINNAGDND
ncbi:MAG: TetR/AcrR family transcriptional regulator [Cyclobacteriaceae bacterium]